MKTGTYVDPIMQPTAIETMIAKVDMLEGVIDRMIDSSTVADTISKHVNLKEVIEQDSDQKKERIFTSKVIDSQMGEKLGVVNTGVENRKVEGTVYVAPRYDDVEDFRLVNKLSNVKKLFQELRYKSITALKQGKPSQASGGGPWP